MTDTDFASIMIPVAKELWGDPSELLSTDKKLCWGSHGGRVVDIAKGVWYDHQVGEGGGVLDLIERELPADEAGALEWLADRDFIEGKSKSLKNGHDRQQENEHAPLPPDDDLPLEAAAEGKKVPVKGYRYTNSDGEPLYEVIRQQFKLPDGAFVLDPKTGNPKKTFFQRRQMPDGSYVNNLGDVQHTIYRHPQVEQAIAEGKTIFNPEGEKDVETLEAWGLVATTNSGGAKNWTPRLAALFKDADVVILVDNDDVGRAAGETKAKSLKGIARRIRVLDLAQHVPAFPEKADVSDWKEVGATLEMLMEALERTPDWKPTRPASKFRAVQMHQLNRPDLKHEFLVDGTLDRKGIAGMAGESQGGKTFAIINLGGSIAAGIPFFGKDVLPGLVVHQAGEGEKGLGKRLDAWMGHQGIVDRAAFPYVMLPQRVNLFVDDKDMKDLVSECKDWEDFYGQKMRLLVIDTWNKATRGANEISGQDVGRVLERMEKMADELDCLVLFVHHMNASGARVRGHSSMLDDLNNLMLVTKTQITDQNGRPIRTMVIEKNKDGERGKITRFVLRRVLLEPDAEGKEVSTCVVDLPAGSEEAQNETYRLTDHERVVYHALLSAIEKFGEVTPYQLRLPASVPLVVKNKLWKDEVRKVWVFKELETDSEDQRKARQEAELTAVMKRNAINLFNAGIIGRDNDLAVVWRTGRAVRGFKRAEAKVTEQPKMITGEEMAGVPF